MRKKFLVKIWEEEFLLLEPTVELFWLSMYDLESFFYEVFSWNIPKMSEEQVKSLLNTLFSIEENLENKLFSHKDFDKKEEKNFHLLVARLMKFFWNSYKEIMEIPISVFRQILEDFDKIEWKSEEKEEVSKENIRQELKNLSNL